MFSGRAADDAQRSHDRGALQAWRNSADTRREFRRLEQNRRAILSATMLGCRGWVQSADGVIHLIVESRRSSRLSRVLQRRFRYRRGEAMTPNMAAAASTAASPSPRSSRATCTNQICISTRGRCGHGIFGRSVYAHRGQFAFSRLLVAIRGPRGLTPRSSGLVASIGVIWSDRNSSRVTATI